MQTFLLIVALVVILIGAGLFTNGVEWVGEGLGLSEGVVGSILAAIGTALPETLLPVVAIIAGHGASGDDIGIGAILGAPLMLSTLAMAAMGITVLVVSGRGGRGPEIEHDPGVVAQDLIYFLVMYALAFLAGVIHVRPIHWILAAGLVVGYISYVRHHLRGPGGRIEEEEAAGEVRPLHLNRLLRRTGAASLAASAVQTAAGLGVIVGGAEVFVHAIQRIAADLGVSNLAIALLIAPVATELPEALNASVIWARRGKDVLALGNIAGAMVFQSTFPVCVGLLFTPWRLNLTAGVAAAVALFGGGLLLVQVRTRGKLTARGLAAQGILYAGYVVFVLFRLR
jgi:cation:H+ antiporter